MSLKLHKKFPKKQSFFSHIVGIDEVGRGPLAGPVAVCACAVTPALLKKIGKVKDSKQLTPESRELWFEHIKQWKQEGLLRYKVVFRSALFIDKRGIVPAIRGALQSALASVSVNPHRSKVLLDGGLEAPTEYLFQETIIKGDEKEAAIALASIAAKVTRDRLMVRLARTYPLYGFDEHKGYGTKKHREVIKKVGPSVMHRMSFLTRLQS